MPTTIAAPAHTPLRAALFLLYTPRLTSLPHLTPHAHVGVLFGDLTSTRTTHTHHAVGVTQQHIYASASARYFAHPDGRRTTVLTGLHFHVRVPLG